MKVYSLKGAANVAPPRFVFAGVAQLVEHLICNQAVAGSSPIASSENLLYGGIPEWPKGADCKSAGLRPTKVRILLPPQ